ncbi:MAG: DHH family phosphoesterase [Monoglobales bacterium]
MNNKTFSKMFASNTALFLGVLFLLALLPLIVSDSAVASAIGFAVWIALTVYSFIRESKREKDILEYIRMLSFHTDSTSKDSLLRFPLPLSLIRADGAIVWYNDKFASLFGINDVFDNNIKSIIGEETDLSKFTESSSNLMINVGDKTYRVLVNPISSNSSEISSILYWIDETAHVQLKESYQNTRPVVASVIVDNYEEVMKNTPDNMKTVLAGEIEHIISEWARQANGIVKRIERDKYFIIFENEQLDKFKANKFEVLEKIKSLNRGNQISPTASIGIGVDGKTFAENEAFSRKAIDMALGRGGDQAVIKDPAKFTYFGGNSKDVEQYTRVKTRVMAGALSHLIAQADKVIIMGHKNTDLDSFGSTLAMHSAAAGMGKPAYILAESMVYNTRKLFDRCKASSIIHSFINKETALDMVTPGTLIIVVDVYRASITECPELIEKAENIVVIDHHRKSSDFIDDATLTYHEPSASSACEMVTELLQYINDGSTITPFIAEALYAGIELDTKSFTFKTGIRTFEAAAYLRRKGVNPSNIKLLFQSGPDVYKLRTDIVRSGKIYKNQIAIAISDSKHEDIQSIAAAAADEMLELEGIAASFVLCSDNKIIYISGRSIGGINVQFILEKLGGGGHGMIAGAQLTCSMSDAVCQLKEAIDRYIEDTRKE